MIERTAFVLFYPERFADWLNPPNLRPSNRFLRPFGCEGERESASMTSGAIGGTDGTSMISSGSDMTESE